MTATTPDPTDALALVNAMSAALNQHLTEGGGQFWSDDMTWHGPAGMRTTTTLAEFEEDQKPFLAAFPDKQAVDEVVFGCGTYAAAAGHQYATHLGEYFGIPATGRPVAIRYMDIWRAENGRLVENWVLIDWIDWFAQLGIDVFQLVREQIAAGALTLDSPGSVDE